MYLYMYVIIIIGRKAKAHTCVLPRIEPGLVSVLEKKKFISYRDREYSTIVVICINFCFKAIIALKQLQQIMKSTKVQNPRRILHILRSMPMRVHRACAGFGQKLYACALFIIDGLGHVTQRGPRRCRFLDKEQRLFSEIATLFFERLLR